MPHSKSKIQPTIYSMNSDIRKNSSFTIKFNLFFLIACCSITIVKSQGIQGHVAEIISRQEIRHVAISIYQGDTLVAASFSNSSGFYKIKTKLTGRVSMHVTHKDFIDIIELMISSIR